MVVLFYAPDSIEKKAITVAAITGLAIIALSIAWLSSIYPRGITQLFTEFISFSLLIPFMLGAILVSLGLYLKLVGDDIRGYGVVIGIGAAIVIGFIGVVWALMNIPT